MCVYLERKNKIFLPNTGIAKSSKGGGENSVLGEKSSIGGGENSPIGGGEKFRIGGGEKSSIDGGKSLKGLNLSEFESFSKGGGVNIFSENKSKL